MLTLIYRITHFNNLDFILKHGLHCANSKILDPNFTQIGYPALIQSRNDRTVPIEPFGYLSDYIPFYFSVKPPMLYVITRGNNPEVIKTDPENIIYLVSSIEKLEELKIKYVFTDRHANLKYTMFYNKYEDLSNLNWKIINSSKWSFKNNPEIKEIKQSECLVYKFLPLEAILCIGCKTKKMYNNIVDIVNKNKTKIKIIIKPDWYY